MHRSVRAAALLAAATLCACKTKDAATGDSAKVAQSGSAAAAPAASASLGSFDAATHTAVVHAKDYAFDAPDTITAGWTTFHLVNDGAMLHHVQLARLDSGKTATDAEAALKNPGPPPRWMVMVGGPNAPDPHGQDDAVVDMTPGNYMILCMVDVPGGVPHVAKGMFRPLTVTAGTGAAAAEPVADATISLADYAFTVSGTLTPGSHVIKVVNNGSQPHEVEMVKLAPGKTANDMLAWIQKSDGPPPGSAIGGVAGMAPGSPNYFKTDFTPGNYAFFCFLPDAKDGKPHVMHGMVKEFKIG
ncbi:MAG TPA: hypothetical protein VGM67_01345 [Gemmatimonadaceae bacterium]|jgi:hypothetical protein